MLQVNPIKRISIEEIKSHPFFEDVLWVGLYELRIPFEDRVKGTLDCAYPSKFNKLSGSLQSSRTSDPGGIKPEFRGFELLGWTDLCPSDTVYSSQVRRRILFKVFRKRVLFLTSKGIL